ncbi:MAG: DUF169 domain-containing protein [Bacteroidales bacterium]|nr:DUF169 domain-containing protein [Bacteroidales bacterium]
MNNDLKEAFLTRWRKYFGDADLPIVFWYTYADGGTEWAEKPKGWSCIICELVKARNGVTLVYNAERVTCGGGRRYLGFTDKYETWF